jgi:acyl-[acyl-carrier-protein]-phospholipid O-acyltransferase/long-chain-fatty-acid--[acyl-carrier-protein] ligase
MNRPKKEEMTDDRPAFGGVASRRGFWALIITQFQGAFSDNFFKFILIMYVPQIVAQEDFPVTALSFFVFNIPFLLVPSLAGALADRLSKQRVTVLTKYLEFVVMGLGLLGFLLGNALLLWSTLFLMALQSAFFSPAKYGILPEILPESRLSWGNGVLEMATFIGIIAGTAVAGPLFGVLAGREYLASIVLLGLSGVGLLSSHFITKPPPASPHQPIPINPWSGMGRYFGLFYADRWLMLTMLGIAYFWFLAVLTSQNIIEFANAAYPGEPTRLSYLMASMAFGIGLGSVVAGLLSRSKIEVGLIPLGGMGLTLFCGLLGLEGWSYGATFWLLLSAGFFAGVFHLPMGATLQHRSPNGVKGGMIAASNFVTFSAMSAAAVLFWWLFNVQGLSASTIFVIIAALSLAVTIYICYLLPFFLLRFILWSITNTFYNITAVSRTNLPDKGGALLVANHTSFMDALLILASTDRPIRFIMYKGIYDSLWVKPLAKIMKVIPIATTQSPRELITSLKTATEAIKEGEVVCIFAEGQISRSGQLLPFQKGFQRIMKGVDAPIIPIHLGRIWGSIFSFDGGRFLWKVPKKIPYPIIVSYGAPLPGNCTPYELRHAIQALGTASYARRRFPLLHRSFAKQARRHPFKMAMADGRIPKLNYLKALAGSFAFARALRRVLNDKAMVGLLLPPSVGGALTNIAVLFMGKVPVNLNYTASPEALDSAAQQCDLSHVITSREFLEKARVEAPVEAIFLEDVKDAITPWDRAVAMAWACLCPLRIVERFLGAQGGRSHDDLATVIFSSGSEGDPKGVMLTHGNIATQVEGTMQVFPHSGKDGIMGMLPFFHSMGFMATIWLPLLSNMKVVYHPSPLEAGAIGESIYKHNITFLIATSTLLQNFIRRCIPMHMSSLHYVMCGAEKLSPQVRDAFLEKFGIEPIEGYGTTECAPVVAMNIPNLRRRGFFQRGTKQGTVGHPIPGVTVSTLDADTGDPLTQGEEGLMIVRGPNVMKGYLGQPEKTATVLQDGWYHTGDMAAIDEDGFITITGRLSRFSKIAGEMVPHGKVEEALHEVIGLTEQSLVVVGLPDEKKGERLVVLHTLNDDQLAQLKEALKQTGLPNLWLPNAKAFHKIEAIPVLGTGKMDLRTVKEMAADLANGE